MPESCIYEDREFKVIISAHLSSGSVCSGSYLRTREPVFNTQSSGFLSVLRNMNHAGLVGESRHREEQKRNKREASLLQKSQNSGGFLLFFFFRVSKQQAD